VIRTEKGVAHVGETVGGTRFRSGGNRRWEIGMVGFEHMGATVSPMDSGQIKVALGWHCSSGQAQLPQSNILFQYSK
jgi:hypothetical protein